MARGLRSNKAKALRRLRREKLEAMERAAKKSTAPTAQEASLPEGTQQEAQQHSAPGTAGADTAMPAVESTSPAMQAPAPQDTEAMEIEEAGRGKQEGLGVSKKSMKGRKQSSVLNKPLHEKRKKGKKKPRAWFRGE